MIVIINACRAGSCAVGLLPVAGGSLGGRGGRWPLRTAAVSDRGRGGRWPCQMAVVADGGPGRWRSWGAVAIL